jgi:AcrR family transcriptional regulator
MASETDPARAMALLWGRQERPNRGPKPTLSVEAIVAAAIKVADSEGLAALSMRRVAETLGVGTMSLYTHVPGKTELFELMLDAAMGEGQPFPEDFDGWRTALEWFARESLLGYRRHPWLLAAPMSRGLMGPHQTAALEWLLRNISGIGLRKNEMMAVVELVIGFVQGVAQRAAESARVEQRTGVTDEQFWRDLEPVLDTYIHAASFPVLADVFSGDDIHEWPDTFEFSLQRVLDGIEAFLTSRASS